MLTLTKKTTLSGASMIDGKQAQAYAAVIDSANPSNMTISRIDTDKALSKANRSQCRMDCAAFEDEAYALQDALVKEMAKSKETGNE